MDPIAPQDTLLCADFVITQDDKRSIITSGAVWVQGECIVRVGRQKELLPQALTDESVIIRHLGNAILLPGLINAHTHLPMSLMRGIADDVPLMSWLQRHIFPVEKQLTPHMVRIGTQLSCAELIRTGCTAFCDMYMPELLVAQTAADIGLRGIAAEGITCFPTLGCPEPDKALQKVREQAQAFHGHPLIRIAVAPHSVYTTSQTLLENCAALAEELNAPLHIHLAETQEETSRCLREHGCRPVEWCRRTGILSLQTLAAHCVDVTDEEIHLLAEARVTVAHNPKSNMKLASGVAPVPQMLRAGVNVTLGTDGAASNNTQNIYSEMTAAALVHKGVQRDATVMTAQSVLDMSTRNAAHLFDIAGLGTLSPGAPADLTALSLDVPGMNAIHSPVSHTVYAATGLETILTMVNGRILYDYGAYPTMDYPAIRDEAQSIATFLRKRTTSREKGGGL